MQTEVPGTERPKIDAIEEAGNKHLASADTAASAKEIAKADKASVLAAMTEHISELEHDEDGNHIYVLHRGDERKVFVLVHGDSLRVRNEKKAAQTPDGDIG